MSTLALFDNNSEGFRLHYMEIYNWGTFGDSDHKIYKMTPNGNNSLLTGANGSGKTTLVDALLTLLVPRNKRFYNQSSGTDQKKERDETSYVLGHYGKTQTEEQTEAVIQQLRTKDDYSVLLAFFYNEGIQQEVTLAQVRWFSNNELKRAYIISPSKMSIKEHISPFDTKGEWKKRLKKIHKTEIYDSFSNYATDFAKIFGFRSEKALSLFSQMVGIKVLGNLNEFIRANMLEEVNVEEEFQKLRENYDDLISAHKAIEKAREQLGLLEPIVQSGNTYEVLEKEAGELDEMRQIVPAYFAEKHNMLLNHAIINKNTEIEAHNDRLETLKKILDDLHGKEISLMAAKNKDELNSRVSSIEEKIRTYEEEKMRKEKNFLKYDEIVKKIDYPEALSESAFIENIKHAKERIGRIGIDLGDVDHRIIEESVKLQSLTDEFNELSEDLQSYSERKTQIPPENIRIRAGILEHLGVNEDEVPFVGELLRVKDEEKEWEPALESLLHNFGLRLLVPEKYYKQVNQYVNNTRLNGRIVYHKIDSKRAPNIFYEEVKDSVATKIDIKPSTQFKDWLQNQLQHQFDYICTDNLEDFHRHRKAITRNRLKKNLDHHEKDDRNHIVREDRYILGWDNKDKLRIIRQKLQQLDMEIKAQNNVIEKARTSVKDLNSEREWMNRLLNFDKFSEIDWKSVVIQIQGLSNEKTELLKSSNNLQRLDKQLKAAQKQSKEKQQMNEEIIGTIANLKRDVSEYERKIEENNAVLKAYENVDLKPLFGKLIPYLEKYNEVVPTLENIEERRSQVMEDINSLISQKNRSKAELAQTLIRQMGFYKNPSEEITKKYPGWTGDTINLEPRISYIKEYRAIYERIKTEDLPKYQERFRKYLNESIIEKLTDFKTSLENQLENIIDSVIELNGALRQIDFNLSPPTYIELVMKNTTDIAIKQFRIDLAEWQPDMTMYELTKDDRILEESFLKIQKIIQQLSSDELWRRKVTDVRNWLEFSAKEFYRADNVQFKYYESSSGLSGGEKAQLSYTILGASIAYQFGINQQGKQPKSFRFIAVDEAFSKLDPDKSQYLMQLCRQLHLQLLVVTPLDKIHIVEPVINACHYVENRNKRNSVVYDLTIEQYYEKKKEFEKLALQE